MKTIEWTDRTGTLNVLVPDSGLTFYTESLLPHEFEARRYMDGSRSIVTATCWCHATADHPIHLSKERATA